MRANSLNVGLIVAFLFVGEVVSTLSDPSEQRTGKHFSLFSVVTFKNEQCSSDNSLSGGSRMGTCYTTTECTDKGGMQSGNCASGFGVCCIFIDIGGVNSIISNNRTHIRNPEYPAVSATATAISIAYTLQKMSSDICQIRLDFTQFVIAGPANSFETITGNTAATINHCTNDDISFVQTGGQVITKMCGALTGEHLYLDLGADATDTSVVTITAAVTVVPATAQRIWDFTTSQIECYARYRAPEGCHRYFTTDIGKIVSFNFMSLPATTLAANGQNTGLELGAQNINTCIRRSKGMCCVEYLVCTSYNGIAINADIAGDGNNNFGGTYTASWTIDTNTQPMIIQAMQSNAGMVDGQCSGDYVEIPSSWSGSCGPNASATGSVNTRYCGASFGANLQRTISGAGGNKHTPVCDCSQPFNVRHSSDMSNDLGGPANVAGVNGNANAGNVFGRGFCLDFVQKPCQF